MEHQRLVDDIPLLGFSRLGVSAPTLKAYKTVTGAPAAHELYAFSASQVNKLTATYDMLHRWEEGSPWELHVHWKTPTNAAAGVARWFAAVTVANADNGETELDWLLTVDESVPANIAGQSRFISLGTIHPITMKMSSQLIVTWGRVGNHANDTLTAESYVTAFGLHFISDSNGSTALFNKVGTLPWL